MVVLSLPTAVGRRPEWGHGDGADRRADAELAQSACARSRGSAVRRARRHQPPAVRAVARRARAQPGAGARHGGAAGDDPVVRARADLERRLAAGAGVPIARPYRPRRASAPGRLAALPVDPHRPGHLARLRLAAARRDRRVASSGWSSLVVPLYGLEGVLLLPLLDLARHRLVRLRRRSGRSRASARLPGAAAGRGDPGRRPGHRAVAALGATPRFAELLPGPHQGRRAAPAGAPADRDPGRHRRRAGRRAAPDRARPARRRAGPAGGAGHDHRAGRGADRARPGGRPQAAGRGPRVQRPRRWPSCATWSAASTRRCSPSAGWTARSGRWR